MFSSKEDTVVDYSPGNVYNILPINLPYSLKNLYANNILMSGYMVVRSNCEEACSAKLLGDISDEEKSEYRENSKIGQSKFKTRSDDLQNSFDSCLRRCFGNNKFIYLTIVQRVTTHFGKDIQDYVYATAFEYQQNDFHYFDVNHVSAEKRIKQVNFAKNENLILDNLVKDFSNNSI
jgi:hypothetical protein